MSPVRSLVALVLMPLLLTASVSPAIGSTDAPERLPDIYLVEARDIELPDSMLLALSPDGASIAVSRPLGNPATELCVLEAATLAERVCTDLGALDAHLFQWTVVWSPDSRWLTFSEIWPSYFLDGDLWLMDAATGELTNLLDDGYRGELGEEQGVITLPSDPTFTPDSTAITFARTFEQDGDSVGSDVATIPITGGDAVRMGDLERGYGLAYAWPTWAPDGSRLYVSDYGGGGPDAGIWVLETGGERARQLSAVSPGEMAPIIVEASAPDGDLLVYGRANEAADPVFRGSSLVDAASGAVEPIRPLAPEADGRRFLGLTHSPDGSLLLTIASGPGRWWVAVRDIAGTDETIVYEYISVYEGTPSIDYNSEANWAANDTVLLHGGGRHGHLLVLERGSGSRD